MSPLHIVDWLVLLAYVLFALGVGLWFSRRAGQSVDEYFLSGRTLPWWVLGTSMVATTFAADTPLVISGWTRDSGVWKNWTWWCLAVNTALQVFLFSRWWRRGRVMTKAELAELRYGGKQAGLLRGALGILHCSITNTIVLSWVLLAAAKISAVVFGVPMVAGLMAACAIALVYSLLSGFWGVVMTDLAQFAMAMGGAFALAWLAWGSAGGWDGIASASQAGAFSLDLTNFFPPAGEGGFFDASFWTTGVVAVTIYFGVTWWAAENVDGSSTVVQRVAAAKTPRHGMLGTLWYAIAHFALRPWLWITVALASLVIFPNFQVESPVDGRVLAVEEDLIRVQPRPAGAEALELSLYVPGAEHGWRAIPAVEANEQIKRGERLAATDSERAYLAMMRRFLPPGLLGLVAASLVAAFMSTIDTHINLAASYFVNDVYRRFLNPGASDHNLVAAGRLWSFLALLLGALLAFLSEKVSDLFLFFMALTAGVGPVYVLRWLWWRVRASTEIAAMATSAIASTMITLTSHMDFWNALGVLSPAGPNGDAARVLMVVMASSLVAGIALLASQRPDPAELLPFFRRVRPYGFWGPVRALAPEITPARELPAALLGALGTAAVVYGALFGIGGLLFERRSLQLGSLLALAIGGALVVYGLRKLEHDPPEEAEPYANPGG